MPREDLRKIGARDRHAAAKIAEIRERHPNAVIFVLFGESHLAPGHLPRALREQMPDAKVLTVLQNIDALYWRAAGERADKVEARPRQRRRAVRIQCHAARKIRKLSPVSRSVEPLRRWSGFRSDHLQPDRQPGALSRNQPLLAAQRHAAEVSGRHAAGSLRRTVRRHAAPAAVAQRHCANRIASRCSPVSRRTAAPTCRR